MRVTGFDVGSFCIHAPDRAIAKCKSRVSSCGVVPDSDTTLTANGSNSTPKTPDRRTHGPPRTQRGSYYPPTPYFFVAN